MRSTSETVAAPTTTAPPDASDLPVPEDSPGDPYAPAPVVVHGTLELPSIGVAQPLHEGVTLTAIDRGPSHWPGTAMPGRLGNVVVAGHRTTHTQPFHDLDRLAPGDPLVFRMSDGSVWTYELTSTEIVGPDAMHIVDQAPSTPPPCSPAIHRLGDPAHRRPLPARRRWRLSNAGCTWAGTGPACDHRRCMRRTVTAVSRLGTVLVAAALPPWGWWPLAFGGPRLPRPADRRPAPWRPVPARPAGRPGAVRPVAGVDDRPHAPRLAVATVAYAALFGLAVTVVPATAPGRWLALPGAIALTELLRGRRPFGGVPLSSLAVGQVAGPLAPVLRLGGGCCWWRSR